MLFLTQLAVAGTCTAGASGLPCPDQAVLDVVDEACEYRLLHDLTITSNPNYTTGVPWSVDNTAAAADDTWSRIALLMEIDGDHVWVSMDDYTGNNALQAGIAHPAGGFSHQTIVSNMNVRSNVVADRDGVAGNIEMWQFNYTQAGALGLGGNNGLFDFDDTPTPGDHGSYQVHDFGAGETLFALNRFNRGQVCEIGLGTNPSGQPDWTFEQRCNSTGAKRLRIFLKVDGDDTCGGGGELVETVVGGTPGFETVLDSGPAKFDIASIESRLASLEDDWANAGCSTERWAGTQARGRTPVLLGETEGGRTVTGTSIADGDVDGTAFSASLSTGSRLVGSTADGTDLDGYFARVSSKKSIWYGVEATCPID